MKLAQQLVREIKRKPGKASLLALLVLVAAWFWGPLVGKWFGGDERTEAAAEGTSVAAVDSEPNNTQAMPEPVSPAAATSGRGASWKEVLRKIESDPRMRPQGVAAADRNPFAAPREIQSEDREPTVAGKEASEDAPEAEGGERFALEGTFGGSRRRVAMINGKSYDVGDEIASPAGKAWIVKQIDALSVVLVQDGRELELSLIGSAADAAVHIKTSATIPGE